MLQHCHHISTHIPSRTRQWLSHDRCRLLAVITMTWLAITLLAPRTASAQATVINVSCGQPISYSGASATIVLQPCTYPSLNLTAAGSSVVVEGNGAIIDRGGVGGSNVVGNFIFRDVTFTHGNFDLGGGLKAASNNLVFERVTFTENQATLGGAVYILPGYDTKITFIDSTISNNTARQGGGLYWKASSGSGSVQMIRTTFSGNRAVAGAPDADGRTGGSGGAIHIVLADATITDFVMQNSTISSNSADQYGGGLYLGGSIKVQIGDSTLTANSARSDGDAFYDAGIGLLYNDIRRTIIAGNGASSMSDCGGLYHDVYYDSGNNLLAGECRQGSNSISAPTGGPGLAPLADNGGRTKTHLPLPGSPALNAIAAGVDGCGSDPAADQRGITRPQGSGCDIGAVEVEVVVDTTAPVAAPTLSANPNAAGWHNAPVTVTWNWTDNGGAGIDTANCTTASTSSGEGELTLAATCTDRAGNLGSSSLMVHVDTTTPDTQFTATPPASTTSTSASFSFTGSDATAGLASFECQLDAGAFALCTSPQNLSGLALGTHTFTVRSRDIADNADPSPASYAWDILATPTNTPTATPTQISTNTPTNTAVPPTATNIPTNTAVPPTATNIPTNTAVPPTATNTAVPLTATPSGAVIGTCGPITVYRNAQGKLVAPGWSGTIKVGTNGANTIAGTRGRDLMLGLGGNDILNGQGGDDLLCGGDGGDLLTGGAGNDYLDGGAGNDVLNGGTGDFDTLIAGDGNDILLDGDGVATAQGGLGKDGIALALHNGWRNSQGQASFSGLAAGYGDDKVGLAVLGTTALFLDISGDERDNPPNPLEGQKDGFVLAGPIDPASILIKFEQQAVISASIGTSFVDQGFDLDPTTLTDEGGSEFLSEPAGGDEPVEEAPAVAGNLLFLPLVSR